MSVSTEVNLSSSSDTIISNKVIQNAKLRSRKVAQKNEKEPSLLEAVWVAISNFFSSLCCCSKASDSSSSEDAAPKYLPKKPMVIKPIPSSTTSVPPSVTQPIVTPNPPVYPSPPSTPPLPFHPNPSPPSTTAATPPKKPDPVKPTPPKKEKPTLPLYTPLEQLKKKREAEISYSPKLPVMEAIQLPKPEEFSLIQEIKEILGEPKVKVNARRDTQAFVEKMKGTYQGLLNGKVTLTVDSKEKSFEGEIVHPHQIELAKTFVQEQLTLFNNSLSTKDWVGAPPINVAAFFAEFQDIEAIIPLWESFWEMVQKPYLTDEDLNALEQCSNQFPPAIFATRYPLIDTGLKALSRTIGQKMVLSSESEKLLEIKERFIDNGYIPFDPQRPQDIVALHLKAFSGRLRSDVLGLFQNKKEQEGTEEPKFEKMHVDQMFNYIVQEVEHFNESMGDFIEKNQQLRIECAPMGPQDFAKRAFEGIAPLVQAWEMMEEMLSTEKKIDEKIDLLSQIAQNLPRAEEDVWIRYPRIKDGMGITLIPLGLSYFSTYKFEIVSTGSDHTRFDEDQLRLGTINSAFETMAKKLGCEQPKMPEIVMDTEGDATLGNTQNALNYAQVASKVAETYRKHLNLGEDGAAQLAAQHIFEIVHDLDPKPRFAAAQQIISFLRAEIQEPIGFHLQDIIYKDIKQESY